MLAFSVCHQQTILNPQPVLWIALDRLTQLHLRPPDINGCFFSYSIYIRALIWERYIMPTISSFIFQKHQSFKAHNILLFYPTFFYSPLLLASKLCPLLMGWYLALCILHSTPIIIDDFNIHVSDPSNILGSQSLNFITFNYLFLHSSSHPNSLDQNNNRISSKISTSNILLSNILSILLCHYFHSNNFDLLKTSNPLTLQHFSLSSISFI